jgi:hypothetical protein
VNTTEAINKIAESFDLEDQISDILGNSDDYVDLVARRVIEMLPENIDEDMFHIWCAGPHTPEYVEEHRQQLETIDEMYAQTDMQLRNEVVRRNLRGARGMWDTDEYVAYALLVLEEIELENKRLAPDWKIIPTLNMQLFEDITCAHNCTSDGTLIEDYDYELGNKIYLEFAERIALDWAHYLMGISCMLAINDMRLNAFNVVIEHFS